MQKPNLEMTERILAFDVDFELYPRDIEKSFKGTWLSIVGAFS